MVWHGMESNPDLWIFSQELWPLNHRGGQNVFIYFRNPFIVSESDAKCMGCLHYLSATQWVSMHVHKYSEMAPFFLSLIFQRNRETGLLGNLIWWDVFVPAGHSGKCVQSVSLRSGSKGQAFFPILFSVPRVSLSAHLVYVSARLSIYPKCVHIEWSVLSGRKGPTFRKYLSLLSSEKRVCCVVRPPFVLLSNLLLAFWDWVRVSPLGTLATNWINVQAAEDLFTWSI
jgi:hypothetical protein